jgi:glycosidase
MRLAPWLLIICLAAPAAARGGPEDGGSHRASPDWRDQVVYFLMIDRFADGDASNNDQGAGEYDPNDPRKYSGGDLAGITQRLDYLKELGVTALWITPPVANQWWDGQLGYGGYHGYWAEHFMRVDAHYGSLDDYRALSRALHGRGMALIQDVVVNHTGNFFSYHGGWDASDPTAHYLPNPDSQPVSRPSQWPFRLNDPRDPAQREAAIYHWTPSILDFTNHRQELDFALADLDDLNTGNAVVRQALRESYGYWIREVGVDAFRVDTAFHVPPDFFADFMHSDDPDHPGMVEVARQTGRQDFLAFGEGFGADRPFAEERAQRLETYVRDPQGRPLLSSMIDFPLYGSLGDAFARGRPPAELGFRIESRQRLHADVHRMPSFVDNHDVDRFLAGGSEAGLKQTLLAILTLPGIPTIYYGTEQGFIRPRQTMFAGGFAAGGRDHFDTDSPLFGFLREAIALRRAQPTLSRGQARVLFANAAAPGAIAWRMDHAGETLLVLMNTADGETLLDNLDTGLAAGSRLRPLFDLHGRDQALAVDSDGKLSVKLPARAGSVWRVEASTADAGAGESPARADGITLDGASAEARSVRDAALSVSGRARSHQDLLLVLDGQFERALPVQADADGRWRAELDVAGLVDPTIEHRLVAWSDTDGVVSAPLRFRVEPQWRLLAEVADPAGDDHGREGRYVYPTDPGWAARQADIRRMRAFAAGGSLRIELQMAALSAGWNPPNGFDRVAFTLFIELPGRDDGARVMPLQNGELPGDMRWHYRLRVGGWSNALFAAEGASASSEGQPVSPAPRLQVDAAARTLSITLSADVLGQPASWSGGRVYVNTWDYDGRYRDLLPAAGSHAFGGGGGGSDALTMDEAVLELP